VATRPPVSGRLTSGALAMVLVGCSAGGSGGSFPLDDAAAEGTASGASGSGGGESGGSAGHGGVGETGGASPTDGAAPSDCELSAFYGQGAAVVASNWSSAELAVRVLCGNQPAARSVKWLIGDGSGGLSETASTAVAASIVTTADAAGIARVVYRHPSPLSQPSWSTAAGSVQALLEDSAEDATSFFVTVFNPGSQVPLLPQAQILVPSGSGNGAWIGSGPPKGVLKSAIQVVVASATGVHAGQGVENIGIRLFGADDDALHCVGPAYTALTGSDGIASCDLELPATPGEHVFDLDVGRVLTWKGLRVTVTP
jgi:hypothetical protein